MEETWKEEYINMMKPGPDHAVFTKGDEVVVADGAYQGTPGIFLRLKEDVNWAEIKERDGSLRSHPVAWLAHAKDAIPIDAK